MAPGNHSNIRTWALNRCTAPTPFPRCTEVCGYLHLTAVSCMVHSRAAPARCPPQCFSLSEVQTVSTSCTQSRCDAAGCPLIEALQVKQHVLFNQKASFSQLEGKKNIITKKKKLRKQAEKKKNTLPSPVNLNRCKTRSTALLSSCACPCCHLQAHAAAQLHAPGTFASYSICNALCLRGTASGLGLCTAARTGIWPHQRDLHRALQPGTKDVQASPKASGKQLMPAQHSILSERLESSLSVPKGGL